jgi:hypothetical protein
LSLAWRTGLVVEVDSSQASLSNPTSSSSSSSAAAAAKPVTYQALVRQLDKPEYKIEVLVRVSSDGAVDHETDHCHASDVKGKDQKKQEEDSDGKDLRTSTEQKLFQSVLHVRVPLLPLFSLRASYIY